MTGMIMTGDHVCDPAPGAGRRRPRAVFHSDAGRLLLNGSWSFRLSPTALGTGDAFIHDDADLSGWTSIPVPAHWVLEGHGRPLYTNTAFPFPIDPPHVPEDNPTGDYRRTFDLPQGWTSSAAVLRFHGVDSCAQVWLNGVELGHSKGSRLPFEFEVGSLLRPSGNVLAVRVHRWSSGSYLEDQDMWWLPGIFRDVELLERPPGSIDDFQVQADYDHQSGAGSLRVDADVAGTVHLPDLQIDGLSTGETITVPDVRPWSAEDPHLYRGELRTRHETIGLIVGFRTVQIVDGRLMINGSPVLFRGVNRHEHHPDHGRALPLEVMRQDLIMMKQHNINAVRTSHYPPHPHFLTLCDELGMWVVDEGDIETHGFIYADWEGNPPADPIWRDALLDRTERMVERDKNHPSVVIWSLANESHTGEAFTTIADWIRERDPSRPLHYERDPSYQDSDFYSLMYPEQEVLEAIGRREEETPEAVRDRPDLDQRRRGLPFLLCEYAHAMGNGPGSLADYQRILEGSDRFCGGFIWEWIDHGFRMTGPDGHEILAHGGDIDYQPNGGDYCLDGLVFPDRTPSPALAEVAAVFAPVLIEPDPAQNRVIITNKHAFVDLGHLSLEWLLEHDGAPSGSGVLALPHCPPGASVAVALPQASGSTTGESWVTVRASLTDDQPWAAAGHTVAWGQARLDHSPPHRRRGKTPDNTGLTLGPFTFAPNGHLVSWGGVDVTGPRLDVWRAPTHNDRGQGERNNLVTGWRAVGLDRMLHRVLDVASEPGGLTVRTRVAPAAQPLALVTTYHWEQLESEAIRLRVDVAPDGPWEKTPIGGHAITLPRLGLRMALPATIDRVTWFGRGPGETYADSQVAGRVGRHHRTIDELQTPYVVPQENGNRSGTRWLELTGTGLPLLRLDGEPEINFAARRWTSEQIDAADHPHQLIDSGLVHLNLDHGLHGLGSASCGPPTPARYRVPVEPTSFSMIFSTGPVR